MEELIPIGEAARQGGVSVQTLRHYDKLGLLTPERTTDAGYRLYSARDCLRLELIRTLRGVGFDLGTIGQLLKDKPDIRSAVALQLEALETQARAIERQRVLLKAVLNGRESAMLARLRRLDVLARLSRRERESFLANQLGWDPDTLQGSREVWDAAVLNLPEDMDETQLEAWLELAELAADESFQEVLRQQGEPFLGVDEASMEAWTTGLQNVMARAAEAAKENEPAHGEVAQKVVESWVEALALTLGRRPDAAFERWMLEHVEATSDPRFERYWQLIAVLKGWTYTDVPTGAATWLVECLHIRVRG